MFWLLYAERAFGLGACGTGVEGAGAVEIQHASYNRTSSEDG